MPAFQKRRTGLPFVCLALLGGGSILLLGACGDDSAAPGGCTTTLSAGADDQTRVQQALIEARSGAVVCLSPGTYRFDTELTLNVPGVTLRGTGTPGDTILDFAGQSVGGNGITVTGDHFTIENLSLRNSPGDGVVVSGTTGATFRDLKVSWDAGSVVDNGAYAIYPVNVDDVLIEGCEVQGASDSGIYVGQSRNIIVRDNYVHANVAGIEIENSTGADVYMNHATDNAAGILVFNLPNLPVKDGHQARLFDNVVETNNRQNFALAGNIVASVPTGTGILVLAADDTEIFGNDIHGNDGTGILIVSWVALRMFAPPGGAEDPAYDFYPEATYIHDNSFDANGGHPRDLLMLFNVSPLEDILWDGIVDEAKNNSDGSLDLCMRRNIDARFRDFNLTAGLDSPRFDLAPHDCMHPALPEISIPAGGR